MDNKISFLETLKSFKPKDFIYPGIFLVFLGTIGVVFYSAAHFITQNINKIFSSEQNVEAQALDLDRYKLIAKKLNIEVVVPSETTPTLTPETTPAPIATTTPEETPVVLDKHAITLMVANSTTKPGLAGNLAKSLSASGFNTPKTSTLPKPIATTTITLKEGVYPYAGLLEEVVSKTYPHVIIATTTEDALFDAVITIGAN